MSVYEEMQKKVSISAHIPLIAPWFFSSIDDDLYTIRRSYDTIDEIFKNIFMYM